MNEFTNIFTWYSFSFLPHPDLQASRKSGVSRQKMFFPDLIIELQSNTAAGYASSDI